MAGIVTATAYAGEIGHYAPGVANVRDLAVPEPGFYGLIYNFGYLTDRLNDANGNQINSVTIGNNPGQGVTLDLDVDVSSYALAPAFIWVASKSSGADARNPAVHDSVHAAGMQVGVTAVERVITLNFRWLNEFSATDRFEGSSIGFNFAAKF